MEQAFVSSQRDLLAQRMRTMCHVAIGIIAFVMFFNVVVAKYHMRKSFVSDVGFETTRLSTFILIGIGAVFTLCSALLHSKLVTKACPVVVESACICVMCLAMIAVVLGTADRLTKIMGWSMEEAFGDKYFSDSRVLLKIDCAVTAAHLGFPARWVSMFPLEVTSILLYVVLVFAIGGNEPLGENVVSLSLLIFLVILSALGKRAAEARERQHFMDIIRERSLRCEAEFELSQATSQEGPRSQDLQSESQRRSNADSAPSTSPGSHAFNMADKEDSDLSEQLNRIMKLGDEEHWRIKEEEVKLLPGKVLGCGGFGQVVLGIFCGVMVAVKRPHDKLKAMDLPKVSALCNELRVLRHVRHPQIVGIHGAIVDPLSRKIALVIEFVRGIILDQFLTLGPEASQSSQPGVVERYSIMLGVSNALLYLHTRCPHIVHGDIKGSNTMVQVLRGAVHAKVLDFGMSRVLTRHTQPLGGTLAYLAPEVLLREDTVKCSADIYSFGRLITFIATSIPPLSDMTAEEIRTALKHQKPPTPTWPQGCVFEPSCRALVQVCIQAEAAGRPSAVEVHGILQRLLPKLGLTSEQMQSLEEVHVEAARLREPPNSRESHLPSLVEMPAQSEHELSSSFASSGEEGPAAASPARVSL